MKMQEHIKERKKIFDEKCSRCGACFTACPIVPFTPLAGSDPQKMTRSVMDMLFTSGAPGKSLSRWWAAPGNPLRRLPPVLPAGRALVAAQHSRLALRRPTS